MPLDARCGGLFAVPPRAAPFCFRDQSNVTDRWEFDHGDNRGEWRWVRVDRAAGYVVARSEHPFKTLSDCVQDAVANGYAVTALDVEIGGAPLAARIDRRKPSSDRRVGVANRRARDSAQRGDRRRDERRRLLGI